MRLFLIKLEDFRPEIFLSNSHLLFLTGLPALCSSMDLGDWLQMKWMIFSFRQGVNIPFWILVPNQEDVLITRPLQLTHLPLNFLISLCFLCSLLVFCSLSRSHETIPFQTIRDPAST